MVDDDIEIIDCSLDDDVLGNISSMESMEEPSFNEPENVLKEESQLPKEENENVFVNEINENVFETNKDTLDNSVNTFETDAINENIFGVNTEYTNDIGNNDLSNPENVFVEPVINTDIFGSEINNTPVDNEEEMSDEDTLKQNAIQVFDMENGTFEDSVKEEISPKEEFSEFNANIINNVEPVNNFVEEVKDTNDFAVNLANVSETPIMNNSFDDSVVREVVGKDVASLDEATMLDDAEIHANNINMDSEKPTVAPIEESDEKDSKNTVIFITIIFIILLIAVFLIPKIASLLT